MSKAKSKSSNNRARRSGKVQPATKTSRTKEGRRQVPTRRSTTATSGSTARDGTKGAKIVAMLRAPNGTTIAAMTSATGWQPHSVRGFLAGVVRKRLKLNLVSEPGDTGRVYRVKERRASSAQNDQMGAI